MYKILVCDFYDTLINKDEAIAIPTMLDIDKMRSKALFVVATSGLFRTIIDYNMSYIFSDYIISYNGAYIYDTNKDKAIYKKPIGVTIMRKLSKIKASNVAFLTLNDMYFINKVKNKDYGVNISDIDDFIDFHMKDVYEIRVFDSLDNLEKLKEKLSKLKVKYYLRSSGKEYYLEITSDVVNKFEASKIILDKENIKVSEMVSIGCSSNDYELVKSAGCGVAIKNADTEIKKVAMYTTKKNNTSGVQEVIEKYFIK